MVCDYRIAVTDVTGSCAGGLVVVVKENLLVGVCKNEGLFFKRG